MEACRVVGRRRVRARAGAAVVLVLAIVAGMALPVAAGSPVPTGEPVAPAAPAAATDPVSLRLAFFNYSEDRPPVVGSVFWWEGWVTNESETEATNLVWTMPIPAGVELVPGSLYAGGGTCDVVAGVIRCTMPSLGYYESFGLEFHARFTTLGAWSFVSSVTADQPILGETSLSRTETVVAEHADLRVEKVADRTQAAEGGEVDYAVRVHNAGPTDTAGAVLLDRFPAGATLVPGSLTAWNAACDVGATDVSCVLGSGDPTNVGGITYRLVMPAGVGVARNTATVTGADDPDPTNNSAEAVVGVGVTDLSLEKTASVSQAVVGEPFQYRLRVENNAPGTVPEVRVVDHVPAGFTVDAAAAAGGVCAVVARAVTCDLGDVSSGTPRDVMIDVTPVTAGRAVANTATVSSPVQEAAPDPHPNSSTAVLDVVGSLSGLVTGPDGQPVVGAVVWACTDADQWIGTASAVTGIDGRYVIGDLPANTYRVAVVPPPTSGLPAIWFGGATRRTATPLVVGPSHPGIDVALVAAPSMSGRVVDDAGHPVVGAQVSAFGADDFWVGRAWTTTDADGRYVIEGAPPSTYRIKVVPPAGAELAASWYGSFLRSTATPVDTSAGPVSGIDVALTSLVAIAVDVTGPGALPVVGAEVTAFSETDTYLGTLTAHTRSDGRASLRGLPPGRYRIRVRPPAGSGLNATWLGSVDRWTSTSVTVLAGATTNAGVVLS